MNLDGKRALVTGAGGFIGSHLTEALVRAGAKTRALVHYNSRGDWGQLAAVDTEVRDDVEVILGDIGDRSMVRQAVVGCDLIFHLAALIGIPYSYHAVESYVDTNLRGTLNVLEACRDYGVERLLLTSTSESYGTAQYTPIDEQHPLRAQSPYAATKIAADQLAHSYHAAFGLPVVVLRPFNTFGPRQSTRAVIPTIITQALAGDYVTLGSLSPVRDFLYVADNARGYLAAAAARADNVCGEVINLGTGRGVSIGRLVELVGEILGRPLTVVAAQQRRRPEKSEVLQLLCCAEKAHRLIGWQAQVGLEDGLARTIDHIRCHPEMHRSPQYAI
ncbi:MAG: SDR family NAD(P)-dependent oxidoreductase [Rhodopirellula sp.]|nr:SDR family NAD(P)-dependent oxidoreductase [Rhodopirellula sp.]